VAGRARRQNVARRYRTSVLTPTFRYHPSIVAQAFGTMGAMFPGRVVLGVGTGEGSTKCLRPASPGRNSRNASLACVNPSR